MKLPYLYHFIQLGSMHYGVEYSTFEKKINLIIK